MYAKFLVDCVLVLWVSYIKAIEFQISQSIYKNNNFKSITLHIHALKIQPNNRKINAPLSHTLRQNIMTPTTIKKKKPLARQKLAITFGSLPPPSIHRHSPYLSPLTVYTQFVPSRVTYPSSTHSLCARAFSAYSSKVARVPTPMPIPLYT